MKLALDIGGTYLRWEILGEEKGKIEIKKIALQDFIQELILKYKIRALAISFAGQVCCNKILGAPNIHTSFDPADFGIPYLIQNDLKCAVLAESRYFECDSLAALYCGTGLGSAYIDEKYLIQGHMNLAGEIGHMPYKEAPFKCGCGKNNCLELFASGSGIEKWARHLDTAPTLKEEKIRALYLPALSHGAATLLALINPEILVLGGGVIEHNPFVYEWVIDHIDTYAPSFSLKESKIELSRVQNASLEGAKILLERLP